MSHDDRDITNLRVMLGIHHTSLISSEVIHETNISSKVSLCLYLLLKSDFTDFYA
jgi:hypothetical protein